MKRLAAILVVLAILGSLLYAYYRYEYPLGMCHRCDTQLSLLLYEYAEQHDGVFPASEATPEASISLINSLGEKGCYSYLLRRRDVPEKVVREILKRGELLGPDMCGWHYVEGLRTDSPREMALFWDKEGLGHNGERLPGGGHIVTFVGFDRRHIPAAKWDEFLAEQKRMLAEESKRQGASAGLDDTRQDIKQ